ncbi:hypothetical protein ACFE04_025013 [Oxalis oulophora]
MADDRFTSNEALNKLILEKTLTDTDSDPMPLQLHHQLHYKEDDDDNDDQLGAFALPIHFETASSSNAFAHHPHSPYFGGYQTGAAKHLMYQNSLEDGCYSMYNEPQFHAYGYNPQMHHKPYTSQLFSMNQQFPSSPTQVARSKFPVDVDLLGDGRRLRTGYSMPPASGLGFGASGKSDNFGLSNKGFEDFEFGGIWSGWSKPLNGKSSLLQYPSDVASLKSLEMYKNGLHKDFQHKESFYGSKSCPNSTYKNYHNCFSIGGSSFESESTSKLDSWPTLDEAKQKGRCNEFSCDCSVFLDTISERNRGPRAFKPKNQTTTTAPHVNHFMNRASYESYDQSHKRGDFVMEFREAKFFVIKSYSEDNVHKSIKYGVWASTPNGNKKLDAAYSEMKEKEGNCPIFLLFSVNASAQFCGVAEMVGPVNFEKNVDYWLQDKWPGQFPVKWHTIKDVPNIHFRHILLENNDNKPVTNSRDTQEVSLEQGIEILNIFKNYQMHSSILDDFYFYEERQKAMQERKTKQHNNVSGTRGEQQNPTSLSTDIIKKMSMSFAQAVVLNENVKDDATGMNAFRSRS